MRLRLLSSLRASQRGPASRSRGQGLLEFALVLPLLLLFVLGIIEVGRMLVIYSSLSSAAKQAARYGSVAGDSGTLDSFGQPLPYYEDCAGMRATALRSSILVGLDTDDIGIGFDRGTSSEPIGRCALGDQTPTLSETIRDGYRVVITITAIYRPLVPIVPLPDLPITFAAARTIFTTIVGPTNTPRPDPDLRITKQGLPLVVSPNGTLTYWITATNPLTGVVLANNIVVTDTLPISVTVTTATLTSIQTNFNWTCAFTTFSPPPQKIRCTRTAPLAPGQSAGFSFPVQAPLFGGVTLTNTTGVASAKTDLNPVDNFYTATNQVLPGADLQVNKTVSVTEVGAGTPLTYTISVVNNGGGTSQAKGSNPRSYLTITDTLPAGSTFKSFSVATSDWTCTRPASNLVMCQYDKDLAASATTPLVTVVVTAPVTAGQITNTVVVTPSILTADPLPLNNVATAAVTVTTNADIELFMAGPSGPFEIGQLFTYRANVTNRGPSIANGIVISHTLPAGLAFDSATGWTSCTSAGLIVCTYSATLYPGQTSADLVLTIHGTAEGSHTYTAETSAAQPDPDALVLPRDTHGTATTQISNCQPTQPYAANSTVTGGSPAQVQANGTSESTVTVQLRDRCGAVVTSSQNVTLISSRGGADTITPAVSTTTTGQATFQVKSSTQGTSTYSASVASSPDVITGPASVTFYGCVSLAAAPVIGSQPVLQFTVNNTSGLARRLVGLTLTWPATGSRSFVGVSLQGTSIWTGSSGTSPVTLSAGSWIAGTDGARTVANNPSDPLPVLQLNFSGFTVPLQPTRDFQLATTWDDGTGGSLCTHNITVTR